MSECPDTGNHEVVSHGWQVLNLADVVAFCGDDDEAEKLRRQLHRTLAGFTPTSPCWHSAYLGRRGFIPRLRDDAERAELPRRSTK